MSITVNLDVILAKRKIRSKELAEAIGITEQNLSVLKTGKARAIRFSTLEAICRVLDCQPGDLLIYRRPEKALSPVSEEPEAPDDSGIIVLGPRSSR